MIDPPAFLRWIEKMSKLQFVLGMAFSLISFSVFFKGWFLEGCFWWDLVRAFPSWRYAGRGAVF